MPAITLAPTAPHNKSFFTVNLAMVFTGVVESRDAETAVAPKFIDTFCHALSVLGVQGLDGLAICQIESSWGVFTPKFSGFFMGLK